MSEDAPRYLLGIDPAFELEKEADPTAPKILDALERVEHRLDNLITVTQVNTQAVVALSVDVLNVAQLDYELQQAGLFSGVAQTNTADEHLAIANAIKRSIDELRADRIKTLNVMRQELRERLDVLLGDNPGEMIGDDNG